MRVRLRCCEGTSMLRKRIAPGKKPASATPSRTRRAYSWPLDWTQVNRIETMPHVSMMRDSQTRAPNLWSARLDGISRMMYPMKNTPEASPNWAAVMPRSCSMPLGPA